MIEFFNRASQKIEVEKVYGGGLVKLLYGTPVSKTFVGRFLTSQKVSEGLGWYQNTRLSTGSIESFVKNYQIDLSEYEATHYKSFNDFFIRKFKPGKRPFLQDPKTLPASCEARYFGYEHLGENVAVPVKGSFFSPLGLLGKSKWAAEFDRGPGLLARLCPVDYHRFHFGDDGKVLDDYSIPGVYHSVNPLALKAHPDVFIRNERHVTIFEARHFGLLAFIEVGALGVGKIVQTYDREHPIERGQEKGYFLFGGSTVIVLGQPGRWKPSQDLLDQTQLGRETLVKLGDAVGVAI